MAEESKDEMRLLLLLLLLILSDENADYALVSILEIAD